MSDRFDDETLVAYLDGELASNEIEQLEQSLGQDAQLRQRVSALRATWNLLGDLPEERPNPDLAQSTIELITLDFEKEEESTWKRLRRNRWLTLVLGCVIIAMVGAFAGQFIKGAFATRLLQELPAVVASRSLEKIESADWLQRLSEVPDLVEAGNYLIEQGANSGPRRIGDGFVPTENNARRQWVKGLDSEDRMLLADNLQSYISTPRERQLAIQSMAEAIYASQEDAQQLQDVLNAYWAILDEGGRRYSTNLLEMSLEERVENLEQRVARVLCSQYADNLKPEDKNVLLDWLDEQYQENELMYDRSPFMDPAQIIFQELVYGSPEDSIIREESLRALMENQLSAKARGLLQRIDDEGQRRAALGVWLLTADNPDDQSNAKIPSERLIEYFDSLEDDDKYEYELMPEDLARERLRDQFSTPGGALPYE